MNAHPVVLSHCATRARYSNPAGPPLRSGLAQEGLGRAVKVADREDRLPEIGDTSRGARLSLKRGAGVSGRRSQTARHAVDSTQVRARLHRLASLHRPVPVRVLTAARLEGLLETSVLPQIPRRPSQAP